MLGDVKYALRVVGRTRAWTLMVIVPLALGIGANTAPPSTASSCEPFRSATPMPSSASAQLFGLAPANPLIIGLTGLPLTSVSAFAAYLPARRAARWIRW